MENLPIAGGVSMGAPKDWDPAKSGECLSISVLVEPDGVTTAWRLDAEELAALGRDGCLFLKLRQPFVPVIQIWTQEGTELVGDLNSRTQADISMRAALLHIAVELDRRAPDSVGRSRLEPQHTAELLETIMRRVSALGYEVKVPGDWYGLEAPAKVVELPVLSLSDVTRIKGIRGDRVEFGEQDADGKAPAYAYDPGSERGDMTGVANLDLSEQALLRGELAKELGFHPAPAIKAIAAAMYLRPDSPMQIPWDKLSPETKDAWYARARRGLNAYLAAYLDGAAPSPKRLAQAAREAAMREYVERYEIVGDGSYHYTPTDSDRVMILDAMVGFEAEEAALVRKAMREDITGMVDPG